MSVSICQEKESLAVLERKYADLTGGRSFTLREVGVIGGCCGYLRVLERVIS